MSSVINAYVQAKGQLQGVLGCWGLTPGEVDCASLIAFHREQRLRTIIEVVVVANFSGLDIRVRDLFLPLIDADKALMDAAEDCVRVRLRVQFAERDAVGCRLGDEASRALAEAQADYARLGDALKSAEKRFEAAEKLFVKRAASVPIEGKLMEAFASFVRARVIAAEISEGSTIEPLVKEQVRSAARVLAEAAAAYQETGAGRI